jgi:serine/threonine-protein kinase
MAVEEALGQDYVLHEEIGRGATGVVRRAARRDGGAPLAAKILATDIAGDRRIRNLFLQEEAVLRSLDNDAIVAVHEIVFDRGQLALLMELVDGPNLRTYLAERGGTLPPAEACAMAAQIAVGLAAAHAQGVVHLDLKPENILVRPDTQPLTIKIADFGVAALMLDAGREQPAAVAGTPGYIAPEVSGGGAPTAAADVFALGVVLVEMLTGGLRGPQGEASRAGLSGGLRGPQGEASRAGTAGAAPDPTAGTDVSDPLRPLVDACLSVDPRERPTARAVAARLRETVPALAGIPAFRPAEPAAGPVMETGFSHSTRIRTGDPVAAPEAAEPAVAQSGGTVPRRAGMRSRKTLIALLAALIVSVATLTLGANAVYRNASGEAGEDGTASPTPPPPSTSAPAPAITATYAGRVSGGGATIAIAVRNGKAVAYLCDGHRIEAWLSGTAVDGKLSLTGRDNASVIGVNDQEVAAGSATVGRQRWQFRAPVVSPPSGLYRTAAKVENADVVGGWIVLADGTQVGVVTTDGAPAPAPSLDTERRTTTIDGNPVTATQLDGGADVGS